MILTNSTRQSGPDVVPVYSRGGHRAILHTCGGSGLHQSFCHVLLHVLYDLAISLVSIDAMPLSCLDVS